MHKQQALQRAEVEAFCVAAGISVTELFFDAAKGRVFKPHRRKIKPHVEAFEETGAVPEYVAKHIASQPPRAELSIRVCPDRRSTVRRSFSAMRAVAIA